MQGGGEKKKKINVEIMPRKLQSTTKKAFRLLICLPSEIPRSRIELTKMYANAA